MAVMEVREKPRDEDLIQWMRHLIAVWNIELASRQVTDMPITIDTVKKLTDLSDELDASRAKSVATTLRLINLTAEIASYDYAFASNTARDKFVSQLLDIAGVEVIRGAK